jgi:hypothetical protein
MDKRNVLAVIAATMFVALVAIILGSMFTAAAVTPCVHYSIKAPFVGSQEDTKCSPTPIPVLNRGSGVHDCPIVPVVEVCVGATVYYYLP